MWLLQKMHQVYHNRDCSTRFKLLTFDAILRAKLLFGLESAHLP